MKNEKITDNNLLVTIGVCTRKRPEMVVKCLRSLFVQETDFAFDIVVVENDAAQGSRVLVEELIPEATEKGVEMRYFCEEEQNIAIARNRCVAECRGEFLAFIDDDEWAEKDWLAKLVEAQRKTDAGAMGGYVKPVFSEEFPEYLKAYVAETIPAQEITEPHSLWTNSVLYRKDLLKLRKPLFDPAYGRTGGSDEELSFFFRSKEISMMRTSLSIVYEFQPLSRGTMKFHWARVFRIGGNYTRIVYKYYYRMNGSRFILKRFMQNFGRIFTTLPMLLIKPRLAFFMAGVHIAYCFGILSYFVGYRKIGYR